MPHFPAFGRIRQMQSPEPFSMQFVMKTKLLLLAVVCLLFFALTTHAQLMNPGQMRESPMGQKVLNGMLKFKIRLPWDGQGTNILFLELLIDRNSRTALGISDEQWQQIDSNLKNIMTQPQSIPEIQNIMAEMLPLRTPDDPHMLNADEETINKFVNLQVEMMSTMTKSMSDVIGSLLTPDQMQKMREIQLAYMVEMPITPPNMFEALDLSDAQKQEMENIKKELELEFEKTLEILANGMVIASNKFVDVQRDGDVRGLDAIAKKLAEDTEFKKAMDEIQTTGKAFSTKFKTKMFDVLTDSQWVRLQELVDHPSEPAKAFLKLTRRRMGISEDGKTQSQGWQPGPNSWRPGDPIPEEYRIQRNTRGNFPRPAN